jgi:RNA polymerase sigma-70 factor (ECF subfamily)
MAANAPEEQLFAEVRSTCMGLIRRVVTSCEADPSLRGELVQDILLATWVALPSWRGDASLKTFVASIAQKRSVTHVTRRAREPRQCELSPDLISAVPLPDEEAVRNDLEKRLRASMRHLPIPQREAIVLCFEGFSYSEVGQILGISTNAATLRCQRARETLRRALEQPLETHASPEPPRPG